MSVVSGKHLRIQEGVIMGAYESWFFVKDGDLYLHAENDGPAVLRRGFEKTDVRLCSVEEAKKLYPNELARALEK